MNRVYKAHTDIPEERSPLTIARGRRTAPTPPHIESNVAALSVCWILGTSLALDYVVFHSCSGGFDVLVVIIQSCDYGVE
jgi:hypothetical protein